MKEELNIIKIGGNVINHESGLNQFLIDFSSITTQKLLVHGGGKIATEIGEQMGRVYWHIAFTAK
jgi:acetylglutamate kinase